MDTAPFQLSATQAADEIALGRLSSEALVASCLDRIRRREPTVKAWAYLDEAQAIDQARARDRAPVSGPLHGVPIALKDIIHTADMPTSFGATAFAKNQPSSNAICVKKLLDAGAVILGKTVTTEFAYFSPGPTANPHNPAHTPGGSSSGSAAAVADYQVALSLGTQTAGSIIRPASFTGVFGFKPGYGSYPLDGVQGLAPSLDTLGAFARSAEDLLLLDSVLRSQTLSNECLVDKPRSVAIVRPADFAQAHPEMRTAFDRCIQQFEDDGIPVSELDLAPLGPLVDIQRDLMAFEAAATLGGMVDRHRDSLSTALGALVDEGRALTRATVELANQTLDAAGNFFDEVFAKHALLVTLAAPGAAPEGLDATGDPRFNRGWTLLRLPCLSVPISTSETGLPLGVQLVGPHNSDRQLLSYASYLQKLTGQLIEIPT